MAEHNEHEVVDDRALERAFAALNDVRAPDGLKASTLDAIFALADEEERAQENVDWASHDGVGAGSTLGMGFTLIEGGAGKTAVLSSDGRSGERCDQPTMQTEMPSQTEMLSGSTKTMPWPRLVVADDTSTTSIGPSGKRSSSANARSHALKLRVAAMLLVAILGIGGTAAYALPATHVYATAGDTTFDLGVNVFGITVSAEANNADGKELLEGVDVHNVRFEDAFDRILGAYEDRGGEEAVSVKVESKAPFGGGERLTEQAATAVSAFDRRRAEGAPSDAGDGGAYSEGGEREEVEHGMNEGAAPSGPGGSEQAARQDEGAPQGGAPQDGRDAQDGGQDTQGGGQSSHEGQPGAVEGQPKDEQIGGGDPAEGLDGGQQMDGQQEEGPSEMGAPMVE